jgi:hypothetical protein
MGSGRRGRNMTSRNIGPGQPVKTFAASSVAKTAHRAWVFNPTSRKKSVLDAATPTAGRTPAGVAVRCDRP